MRAPCPRGCAARSAHVLARFPGRPALLALLPLLPALSTTTSCWRPVSAGRGRRRPRTTACKRCGPTSRFRASAAPHSTLQPWCAAESGAMPNAAAAERLPPRPSPTCGQGEKTKKQYGARRVTPRLGDYVVARVEERTRRATKLSDGRRGAAACSVARGVHGATKRTRPHLNIEVLSVLPRCLRVPRGGEARAHAQRAS